MKRLFHLPPVTPLDAGYGSLKAFAFRLDATNEPARVMVAAYPDGNGYIHFTPAQARLFASTMQECAKMADDYNDQHFPPPDADLDKAIDAMVSDFGDMGPTC